MSRVQLLGVVMANYFPMPVFASEPFSNAFKYSGMVASSIYLANADIAVELLEALVGLGLKLALKHS